MKLLLLILALLALLHPAMGFAGAGPELAVVVNESNPINVISSHQLREMLLGEVRWWPNRTAVIIVARDTESEVQQRVLRQILRMTSHEYQRAVLALEFRGESAPLVKILRTDGGAAKFVFNVPGAVAVIDSPAGASISPGVKMLRVDGKLPGEEGYPLK